MSNVRPLRWHDLPFAYRLAGRGMSFDAHLHLLVGENYFKQAQLTGARRTQSYVLKQPPGGGLAVLYFPAGDQHARLGYVSPMPLSEPDQGLWLELLDGVTAAAGQRGAITITAEVDEHEPVLEILRQADFAIYARQDIWLRRPAPCNGPALRLRPAYPDDRFALQGLYAALVPPLIKQVEPFPAANTSYVLEGRDGPSAMVATYQGHRRTLAEIYLHPEVDLEARQVINGALKALHGETQPIYLRVRRYMGWLDAALDDLGFEAQASQAVMVRHTTARVRAQHGFKPLPAMDSALLPTPIKKLHGNVWLPTGIFRPGASHMSNIG